MDKIGPVEFMTKYLGLPVVDDNVDCNNCIYIDMTEDQQRALHTHSMHICNHYGSRCKHNSQCDDAYHIYPCKECYNDEFKHFMHRKNFINHCNDVNKGLDEIIYDKYGRAGMLDKDFNTDNYIWVIGVKVWRTLLKDYFGPFSDSIYTTSNIYHKLLNIPVKIDTEDLFTIKLYKEIK